MQISKIGYQTKSNQLSSKKSNNTFCGGCQGVIKEMTPSEVAAAAIARLNAFLRELPKDLRKGFSERIRQAEKSIAELPLDEESIDKRHRMVSELAASMIVNQKGFPHNA